mmetsp:Transcript_11108/g.38689  ORF Transcript_11108/g.38689 Transcript_11108/m.38689 type:complete len:290 (-) Transcript_11108:913-1782(-)
MRVAVHVVRAPRLTSKRQQRLHEACTRQILAESKRRDGELRLRRSQRGSSDISGTGSCTSTAAANSGSRHSVASSTGTAGCHRPRVAKDTWQRVCRAEDLKDAVRRRTALRRHHVARSASAGQVELDRATWVRARHSPDRQHVHVAHRTLGHRNRAAAHFAHLPCLETSDRLRQVARSIVGLHHLNCRVRERHVRHPQHARHVQPTRAGQLDKRAVQAAAQTARLGANRVDAIHRARLTVPRIRRNLRQPVTVQVHSHGAGLAHDDVVVTGRNHSTVANVTYQSHVVVE